MKDRQHGSGVAIGEVVACMVSCCPGVAPAWPAAGIPQDRRHDGGGGAAAAVGGALLGLGVGAVLGGALAQPSYAPPPPVYYAPAAQMSQAVTERGSRLGTMNAAENMESYAQLAQLHAAEMQRLASVFQSLYNTFPEQQKQAADAVFRQTSAKRMAHRR